MNEENMVMVPAGLWEQVKAALRRLQIPAPAGEVQAFLNAMDAVGRETEAAANE